MTFITGHLRESLAYLFALVAAVLWAASALQRLPDVPTEMFMGISNAGVPLLVQKLRIQAKLSAAAAVATLLSVCLQFSLLLA